MPEEHGYRVIGDVRLHVYVSVRFFSKNLRKHKENKNISHFSVKEQKTKESENKTEAVLFFPNSTNGNFQTERQSTDTQLFLFIDFQAQSVIF